MKCAHCLQDNRATAKFCEHCGNPLGRTCAACGGQVSASAKFCPQCGCPLDGSRRSVDDRFASPGSYTPRHLAEKILTSRAALEGERKQVTVLFADLKSSMELLGDRDPEEARSVLDPILELMMEAVHHYEGTVNQVMGDGIMALFGAPLAHEDHAVRACYAALRMQERVRRHAEEIRRSGGAPIQIRVGLNSGDVVVRSIGNDLRTDYSAVGQTTHLAARMEQMAEPGSILATADTLRLAEGYIRVTSLGRLPIRGLEAPVDVYAVTGSGAARWRLEAAAARGLTGFVGRDAELAQLGRAASQSAAAGHGQVVGVLGEPGVGKSRLFHEFTRSERMSEWLVLQTGAASYGKATSYQPIIELLRAYFELHGPGDQPDVRDKIAGKIRALDKNLAEDASRALLAPRRVGRRRRRAVAFTDSPPAAAADDGRGHTPLAAREPGPAGMSPLRGPALDRLRDPGLPRQPDRPPADRAGSPARQLPTGIPARLGGQDLLRPAPYRSAAAAKRRRSFSARSSATTPISRPSSRC